MAPKRRKGAAAARAAKRARRQPLELGGLWGRRADDPAAEVDWPQLCEAFDALTAPRAWASGLAHRAAAAALPLPLRGDAGARLPLLAAAAAAAAPEEGAPAPEGGAGAHFVVCSRLALRGAEGRGRGWFAAADVPPGHVVLVERPVVGLLDGEWRDEAWASLNSADSAAVGIRVAQGFSPSLASLAAHLHPREEGDAGAAALGADGSEDESDVEATEALSAAVQAAWGAVDGVSDAAKARMRAVVRLNSLGFYTHSEQLCHGQNYTALTGTGVFVLASGFNHSCEPCVARHSIGDITVFVTNRLVREGEELCISYIETELLSAPTSLRAQSLNRDFTCACPRCLASPAADEGAGLRGREFLHVDAQVQANLSLLPPAERVEAVEAALRGEMGDDDEGEEEEGGPSGCAESGGSAVVLGKDAQELRVVQALALMQMQRWADALQVWRRLAAFACRHCPPFDEALVAYATQAALCALAAPAAADSASSACASAPAPRDYAAIAAAVHRVAFGTDLYRWRYRREVQDSVVPESVRASFWAMVEQPGAGSAGAAPWTWGSCDAAWRFEGHEVPEPVSAS